eukprot:7348643-Prymnesium_polylepis.2
MTFLLPRRRAPPAAAASTFRERNRVSNRQRNVDPSRQLWVRACRARRSVRDGRYAPPDGTNRFATVLLDLSDGDDACAPCAACPPCRRMLGALYRLARPHAPVFAQRWRAYDLPVCDGAQRDRPRWHCHGRRSRCTRLRFPRAPAASRPDGAPTQGRRARLLPAAAWRGPRWSHAARLVPGATPWWAQGSGARVVLEPARDLRRVCLTWHSALCGRAPGRVRYRSFSRRAFRPAPALSSTPQSDSRQCTRRRMGGTFARAPPARPTATHHTHATQPHRRSAHPPGHLT